jgi:hypothetical protein
MIMPNWVLVLLVVIIVFLEYSIQKKHLGIIILHNNDHTVNKVVQFVTAFFERMELHFNIVVIKEQKRNADRSTGRLFNIGYRQMSKLDGYLFIDSTYCELTDFHKLASRPSKLTSETIYPKNKLEIVENLCAVFVSREYLKQIDGFSNEPNEKFSDFLKILKDDKHSKDRFGGYLSTNFDTKYHILDRTALTNNAIMFIIRF